MMKRFSKVLFMTALIVALFTGNIVFAQEDAEAEKLYTNGAYVFTVNDDKVTIVEASESLAGSVVVPSNIQGLLVTEIGAEAFAFCTQITEVIVPNTVSVIGERAFANCVALKNIVIPTSVRYVGKGAFHDCIAFHDIWYQGTDSAAGKIHIDSSDNQIFTQAKWHYDACLEAPSSWKHVYNNAFDNQCNLCGANRTASHIWIWVALVVGILAVCLCGAVAYILARKKK